MYFCLRVRYLTLSTSLGVPPLPRFWLRTSFKGRAGRSEILCALSLILLPLTSGLMPFDLLFVGCSSRVQFADTRTASCHLELVPLGNLTGLWPGMPAWIDTNNCTIEHESNITIQGPTSNV